MVAGVKRGDVLNFALAYDLLIANTVFKKKKSHLVTFRSGQHSSQIDFILARREDRRDCLDCKVIPGGVCCPSTQACGGGLSSSGTCPLGHVPRLREQSGGSLEGKRHKRLSKIC